MSKGSNARPFGVPRGQFEHNWDQIFKKIKEEKDKKSNANDTEKKPKTK